MTSSVKPEYLLTASHLTHLPRLSVNNRLKKFQEITTKH